MPFLWGPVKNIEAFVADVAHVEVVAMRPPLVWSRIVAKAETKIHRVELTYQAPAILPTMNKLETK